jgi:putative acetyltransferase
VIVRRETVGDVAAVRAVTAAAFRGVPHSAPPLEPGGDPGEATLVTWLRQDPGWIPRLSLVAEEDGVVVGHVVATRAHVGDAPVLGVGPVSVLPRRQGAGVGSALLHAVIGAADALDEPLVGLLGHPDYYRRFGFVPAAPLGVIAPTPSWGDLFQVRLLSAYAGHAGRFRYAEPFDRL